MVTVALPDRDEQMEEKMNDKKQKPMWVVCCEPRIVLCGRATAEEVEKERPTLEDVRMAVRWTPSAGAVIGLSARGPDDTCRVTPAAPSLTIRTKVECVMKCSEEAAAAWELEPWSE